MFQTTDEKTKRSGLNGSKHYPNSISLIFPWRKKCEHNEAVDQVFVDYKKANDSVRKEVFYNVLIQFGVPMKEVSLINMVFKRNL
jgi:hypothetical protein